MIIAVNIVLLRNAGIRSAFKLSANSMLFTTVYMIHTSSNPSGPAFLMKRSHNLVATIKVVKPCSTPAYSGIQVRRTGST